ncbi:cytochrome b-c1 complex subunit 6 [Senna tora]|uniref:Complex III subunit VI n=1 Tax=Senna tora TaxID=362788 RepID=A0A834VZS4_9FABA|nr:cytochrome b-c1 complex subunit 6 [Senna tora]
MDGNIHSRHIESLKHDLGHLLSVGLGVEWCLSKKYWVFFRGNTKLIVECVMPNLLHVIPIADYTMLYGILQGENTSFRLGFITNISILLAHPNHNTSVARPPNNTWEHSPGGIIASKTSLADEEPVDQKIYLEEVCKPKCVKPLLEYQACVKRIQGDESGQKHCTGQYFDYWHCVDKCVAPKLFTKLNDSHYIEVGLSTLPISEGFDLWAKLYSGVFLSKVVMLLAKISTISTYSRKIALSTLCPFRIRDQNEISNSIRHLSECLMGF